jgi:putative FmdB family regulatory protein
MPSYTYLCNTCSTKFELFFTFKEYKEQPKCPVCKKQSSRYYQDDIITLSTSIKKHDSELKTIGDLANRNRDRMSNDEIESLNKKHNSYKEQETKPLPSGMSRIKKPPKPVWPGTTPKLKNRRNKK